MRETIIKLREELERGNRDTDQVSNCHEDVGGRVSALLSQVRQLNSEKERLENALRSVQGHPVPNDINSTDNQVWILKKTNAQLMEEQHSLEEKINQLHIELADKNRRIRELENSKEGNRILAGLDEREEMGGTQGIAERLADKLKNVFK